MSSGSIIGSDFMVRMVSMMRVIRLIAGVRDLDERAIPIMGVMAVSILRIML